MLKRRLCVAVSLLIAVSMLSGIFAVSASAGSASSISYSFSGNNKTDAGYAEGTITLTGGSSGTYKLYWADDEKALDGYYSIDTMKLGAGESRSVKMGYHTAIPARATKIIATKGDKTVAAAEAVYSVPEEKQLKAQSGDLMYTFNSYSDVHIDKRKYYKKSEEHLAEAFKFGVDKNTDFIVSSGDMVTNKSGPDDEWDTYEKILKKSGYVNPVWESNGNHDMRCGVESGIKSFVRATGVDSTKESLDSKKPYYYVVEKNTGDVFIFMALESESNPSKYDEFSDEQLKWVTSLLDKYYYSGVNVYLIEHSPIKGYGAGDRMEKPYYSAMLSEKFESTKAFKNILKKYNKIIFMSGHTHEDFEMGYNYFNDNGNACHMIHNPAVAGSTKPNKEDDALDYNDGEGYNSQGYYVEAYRNRIVYYGANITDELIYPRYSYIMEGSRTAEPVNTAEGDITLSGTTVPAADKLSEVSDILSGFYKYSSYDQYQALKKLYYKYVNETVLDKNVVAKFDEKIAGLKKISGKSDSTDTSQNYTVGKTYYFENTKGWSKVYAYAWSGSSKNAKWPGVEIKPAGTSNGKDIYRVEFDSEGQYQNLIFNDDDHQTVDIALNKYSENAFRLGDKNSEGKYKVVNFKYDDGSTAGSDTDINSGTDTDPVITDDTYALLYYIEGEHAWKTIDTMLTPKDDGTYQYIYKATDDCKISFSVYDNHSKAYWSLPESLIVYYKDGEMFESAVEKHSKRGKSLTVKELEKDNAVIITYDPDAKTLSAKCETMNAETAVITWKDYDGTTLETDANVPFGSLPTYDGAAPSRPADEQYTYTFIGWDPEVTGVTGDTSYTAVYSLTAIANTDTASDSDTVTDTDAATETDSDTASDVTTDTESDTTSDVTTDTESDTASDVTPDTESDTASDVTTDTESDTASDVTPDTESDTASDAAPDTESDTSSDVTPDTESDTASDAAPDTESDTSADAASDTDSDTSSDTDAPEPIGNLGDVDGDGDITANDALTILRASIGLAQLTPVQTKLADVDFDGNVTANDALAVLRYSVGIIDADSPIKKPITA